MPTKKPKGDGSMMRFVLITIATMIYGYGVVHYHDRLQLEGIQGPYWALLFLVALTIGGGWAAFRK